MIQIDELSYLQDQLHLESVDLARVAATWGTPCYVYSKHHIQSAYQGYAQAFGGADHQICYSVKANSNLTLLNLLARMGSGFDIVSGGELARVLAAGGDPARTVFSGVGKSSADIEFALRSDIGCLNIESEAELERVVLIAQRLGVVAPVAFRVNPDVDPKTHPYISTGLKVNKFGVPIEAARAIYRRAATLPGIRVCGLDCHIGSQLTQISPFEDALERLLILYDQLQDDGIAIEHLDLGGGLGIAYSPEEQVPTKQALITTLLERIGKRPLRLMIEPGRSIVGNSAVLLTRVEYLKPTEVKRFAIVDAGMNDLIRPSLYDAWMDVVAVSRRKEPELEYDVVGPICETGDFLARKRHLAIASGDLLAVLSAGAYGFAMSSNYNSRPRAPEVLVDGESMTLIRPRETVASLYQAEADLLNAQS